MPAYAAPIEVIQAALHRIGEEELPSLDGDDSAARVANSNYEGIVRAAFTRHAWTFAKQTLPVTYQSAVELGPYRHAWVAPSEVINIQYLMYRGQRLRSGDYAIESGRILTRDRYEGATLQVVANVRAHESVWPGDLSEAIVTRLQALFLEALCDKPQDARLKERDADQKMRDAILRDKRQEPGVDVLTSAPLAEAWRRRRGRC
ncbi:hypothetical protein [Brevundimonas sp.]|uniref:hypothetical protein n=1 Tax=Brevundimonas sp. TaxID=1871086 RepID=UPI0025B90044|nr:hypothetical protein [Brevundimonas sp.]